MCIRDRSPDTPTYAKVLLTRETSEAPKKPGTIVLSGRVIASRQPSGGTATTPGNTGGTAAPTTTTP